MLKKNDENEKSSADDGMALILQQAGKSSAEIAALATLDDADQTAENQFSGEAPTIASLFGVGKAREFFAGDFTPSQKVAQVMSDSLDFLMQRKKENTLVDNQRMLFRDDIISGLAERGFFGLAIRCWALPCSTLALKNKSRTTCRKWRVVNCWARLL
jgi:hypothetical protein